MPAPAEIVQLVELFQRNEEQYRSPAFSEAAVRHQFVDPLFAALGWDVNNTQGFAEQYKEVVHEDKVHVGSATKAPDYSFRIGRERKFFVEAKKPAVNITQDVEPAYQLRRYAWSAKLPVSILTDFEEFSVYDCRAKPALTDKASAGRILLLRFPDYITRWDEIAAVFSKAAVWQGALDRFAEAKAGKRGTAEVDDEFLGEIERWRELLARNLALRNPTLRGRDLNWAVQQTIDRIVFLRICEARDLETFEQLRALLNGGQTYARLQELFRRADMRYNSGLFHFTSERARAEAPDTLTPGLQIDDKALKDIIEHLYYPQSPYEFSVLPADILGHVYERFLGKVIRLTPGRQVKIEEKPEVRKAGGVFYTPTYIVNYIVRQTVGPLLQDKTPADVGAPLAGARGRPAGASSGRPQGSPLRVADIACGSGSFLLGAYQFLLDWYLTGYLEDPERWLKGKRPALERVSSASGGGYRLTIEERKRILMTHIYGVDIDPQAVEVTKLSLLLKVLEGEGVASQLSLGLERALPDLGSNIKCGNSLIGPDFYAGKLDLPDEETERRVNAFDWQQEFPEAMAAGGFDAVIGNPPYGFHQIHADDVKPYFQAHYQASHGSFEHYFLFYERSLALVRDSGYHGYIVPVTWLTIPSAHSLRKFILEGFHIVEISWLPELVFRNAQVNTLVSIIRREPAATVNVLIYDSLGFREPPRQQRVYLQERFIQEDFRIGIFETEVDKAILQKIDAVSSPLEQFATPCSGYNPYEVGKGQAPRGGRQTPDTVKVKPYHSTQQLGPEWKPEIVGRDLGRYVVNVSGQRWIKYGPWLAAPRDPDNFRGKRILVQEITGGPERRIIAAYYENDLYYSRDVIPIKLGQTMLQPGYLLGLINSHLITWYHHRRNPKAQKALFPKVLVADLRKLPIRPINFADPADAARHDRMVTLVTQMLDLHRRLAAEGVPHEKALLQRRIEATDRQIDALVYELYGLTAAEIALVEGA